ncbi:MAG: hypothetical protein ACLQK8_28040, partial [Streptosporangiaceae bacterium]
MRFRPRRRSGLRGQAGPDLGEGGADLVGGGEGVAADHVDGDQLRPPRVPSDACVAGVAGGADLADV